ncbi:MAG: aminotransferase class V-fold PLP-dependent enzyme, partial [Planctomycetota bacterium]|nr:aminotransferase class V-fold PLP-dependent enzyme [Planctomycetota bacterium]
PGLVTVMAANNETGVCQDIKAISQLCNKYSVPFHCDAVQAVAHFPGPELSGSCDLMTLTGHKLGGPRGIGALIHKPGVPIRPLFSGGSQENGRRSGTENVAGAVALAAALELGPREWRPIEESRNRLERCLKEALPTIVIHGESAQRLPGFSCFSIPDIVGEALLRWLDSRGIAVSTGSACSTSKKTASPVLLAMTGNQELAASSIRLSFIEPLEDSMQKHVVTTIKEGIEHLRRVQGSIS